MTSGRTPSTPGETPPRCRDIDLDALAYGELDAGDELWARTHLTVCQPCHEAHEHLLTERRRFSARARADEAASLPSFDQLLARAERQPADLGSRWRAMLGSWASPWRGAVLQGAVGMFAVGMLVQVAILRPPRATESARTRTSAVAVQGGPAVMVDPWGESIPDSALCDSEVEVCIERELAQVAPVSDPCAGAQVPASIDWSLQPYSGLDGNAEGICAPDAI